MEMSLPKWKKDCTLLFLEALVSQDFVEAQRESLGQLVQSHELWLQERVEKKEKKM